MSDNDRHLVCLLLFIMVVAGNAAKLNIDSPQLWNIYKTQFQKSYVDVGEERVRLVIFEDTLEKIIRHNLEYDLGKHMFTMGLNQFSDLTFKEYKDRIHCIDMKPGLLDEFPISNISVLPKDVPESMDWKDKGCTVPIRNQGRCGSCYAFSSVGNLECVWKLAKGELHTLSIQQMVDCSGQNGCHGGTFAKSFKYMVENKTTTEEKYPYKEKQEECKYKKEDGVAKLSEFELVPQDDEKKMKQIVGAIAPLATYMNGDNHGFKNYKSGILDTKGCKKMIEPDHGVQTVGYGKEGDKEYWLIKNSWGERYGDKGFAKIAMGENACGIAYHNVYGVV